MKERQRPPPHCWELFIYMLSSHPQPNVGGATKMESIIGAFQQCRFELDTDEENKTYMDLQLPENLYEPSGIT